MASRGLITRSDGSTVDIDLAKAETYDTSRKVEKVLIVDAEGNAIGASHALPVRANVEVGDIEIGAVELKNATDDTRAVIKTDGTNNAVITLSDSTTATTPTIFAHTAGATSTSAYALDMKGLPFFTGLRLTVSGANASVTVIYE